MSEGTLVGNDGISSQAFPSHTCCVASSEAKAGCSTKRFLQLALDVTSLSTSKAFPAVKYSIGRHP